jgi:hypothetical protein
MYISTLGSTVNLTVDTGLRQNSVENKILF